MAASLGPIRAGAGALAAGGLLILAADVLHPAIPITTIASDPTAFASESGATTSVLHGILFQLGYMGLLFGLLALYSYLSWNGKDALARTALLVSLAQIAVVLSFIGVATNAIPLASGSYLAGHHDALDWITKLPTSPAGLIGGVSSSVLGVVGAVLFAIAFLAERCCPETRRPPVGGGIRDIVIYTRPAFLPQSGGWAFGVGSMHLARACPVAGVGNASSGPSNLTVATPLE